MLIGYEGSTFHSLSTQNTTQASKSSDTTLVPNSRLLHAHCIKVDDTKLEVFPHR